MAESIFVCYRRKDWALAQLIARDIESRIEITSVLDDRSIDGDSVEQKLLPLVKQASAVLIIVTAITFEDDRIKRPDDRIRRILNAALASRRPVFPVYVDGARPRYNLPEDIRPVAWSEGVNFSASSYDNGIDKLAHMLSIQVGVPHRVRELAVAGVGSGGGAIGYSEALSDVASSGTLPIARAHLTLPLLEWVNIPGGKLNLHTVVGEFDVRPFAISRYPVTQEQFHAFIDDAGYSNSQWWDGLIYPRDVQVPHTRTPDFPMVNLTWYEAIAYTRWLSYHSGLDLTLPTEAQWQWAAHGEARTLYPWGDIFDLSRCNIKESGFGGLTSVTRYEGGVSPFGVQDMSGNVWEWTRTEYDSPDKDAMLNITSPALRGGSFEERMKHARTTSRARYYPHLFRHDLGFRLACRTWVGEQAE